MIGKGLSLLCVVNDAADTRNLEDIVKTLRWTATFASNGLDGYAFAMTKRFDVILTDQDIDDLTGLGLFKCIRTGNGPNAATPFLLNSRRFTPEIIQAANEMKVEALVEIPLLRSHLKDLLPKLVRGAQAANFGTEPSEQCGLIQSVPVFQKFFG